MKVILQMSAILDQSKPGTNLGKKTTTIDLDSTGIQVITVHSAVNVEGSVIEMRSPQPLAFTVSKDAVLAASRTLRDLAEATGCPRPAIIAQ